MKNEHHMDNTKFFQVYEMYLGSCQPCLLLPVSAQVVEHRETNPTKSIFQEILCKQGTPELPSQIKIMDTIYSFTALSLYACVLWIYKMISWYLFILQYKVLGFLLVMSISLTSALFLAASLKELLFWPKPKSSETVSITFFVPLTVNVTKSCQQYS